MEYLSSLVSGATLTATCPCVGADAPHLLPEPVEPPASPCRFCGEPLDYTFVNLGTSPLCQNHVRPHEFNRAEAFYPLHARVCRSCFLVQLDEFVTSEEIFQNDYAYFSSYSASWLRHARRYTDMATERFGLNSQSLVVEVASNDGYLLQYFVEKDIPVLGIEPATNVAGHAQAKGINTLVRFFGTETARYVAELSGQADLLLGNNVLAHVPDINDFVAGMRILLKPGGVITMEFPHLLRLMEGNQFDTIYHEHFSYLSFYTVERIFAHHGLVLFDVEELPTHGGSLRIFARHAANLRRPVTERVTALRHRELEAGITDLAYYSDFEEKAKATKRKLLEFLIEAQRAGKTVVGYGAPGKGNTLLNYCGIRTDFLEYTVDVSPHKQGNFLPGTRIPICHPDRIRQTQPDYVLILPWNLREEIMEQMQDIRSWGGRFVVPIPEVQVYE
ncbi:SAM-dependent methyltransferase [Hymenobacter luteus]|uniref:SAM-dependent methyltransferase n=2 Tax=Hymenobacter TaxID=89966 RepID=A0A7W9SZD2_9BACT|nr:MULTISPECIES: class I SAM-dependent methyltransferase [Hymenobacter]MBB4601071.1 SAM-dependent methyltransferase [Hymenobacter latericoloratus]MBB6058722.1 SAM-dependent methyltransferase [Hymenobacter luteus]